MGDSRSPGVYAEVLKVLDWVKSNSQAGGNEQCDGSNPPNPTPTNPAPSTPGPTEATTTNVESTTSNEFSTTPEGGCRPDWIGDQYCDDMNNNEECEWDGGDCCQGDDAMDGWDQYCSNCQCLDPSEGGCRPNWIGDGYCDDTNNNEECEWDGGDCCQGDDAFDGWDQFCSECKCVDEPCEDSWPTWFCNRNWVKNMCNRNWVKERCEKTCGGCN